MNNLNSIIKKHSFKVFVLGLITSGALFLNTSEALANTQDYVTTDIVKFRDSASADSEVIDVITPGTNVTVEDYNAEEWSKVYYNGNEGYIKSEYLITKEEYIEMTKPAAELLTWSEAKSLFTIGVPAEVYDVRTGLTYYVKSFSNGNHADVEPVTTEDTQIMKNTYGGRWSWDTRPILVTINGVTSAASINGMPHGGGVNHSNGMSGQVCIHFKGSTTHNGSVSHERDHQRSVAEAYEYAKRQ